MDLWVVAAATGAGYLTKYWQKFSRERDKDGLLPLSFGDANLEKSESSSSSTCRDVDRKPVLGERGADIDVWRGVSDSEVASTSGYDGEKLASLVSYEHCNLLSLSNISPVYQENSSENGDESRQSNDLDDNSDGMVNESSRGEKGSFHVPLRNRRSRRTEHSHGHIVKRLNSLGSFLMAQLYKERAESSAITLASPSALRTRPLIVSDGNRIISKGNAAPFSAKFGIDENKLHEEDHLESNESTYGIPLLPKLGCMDLPKKRPAKEQTERSSNKASGKHLNIEVLGLMHVPPSSSPDGAVLLCLGVSIGIISSFIANRKEVDKLKDVVKQTESLVEDLQEELEMKESVMVKELANENYESQDTCVDKAVNPYTYEQNMDKHDGTASYEQKAESSESIGNMEAELEAELDRLGLNMNTSSLKGRFTDLDELDPELETDFAQGELRAEMVGGHTVALPKSEENASSTSTAHHHGNCSVSPRELSLRLHEVIQSRLQERIKELEAALLSSQKECIAESEHKDCSSYFTNNSVQSTVQGSTTSETQSETIEEPLILMSTFLNQSSQEVGVVESDRTDCTRDFTNSCVQSSTVHESSDFKDQGQTIIEPLVMNLAGEALDAYNEAYEELMKINESEEEDSPCHVIGTFREKIRKQSFDVNDSIGHIASEEEAQWLADELISRFDFPVSEDESSLSDEEMEKQLIQQIVEKTKKGSPVVLNAQKWLFSVNDYDI